MAAALVLLGSLIAGVGTIWILIQAFRESILWGLGCLIVPLVELVFVIMFWSKAKKPFLLVIAGAVVMVVGMMMGGMTVPDNVTP